MLATFEKALKKIHNDGVAEHGEQWMQLVHARVTSLELLYQNLTVQGRPPIDYSEKATQAAYLFAYGTPRAYFTAEFLVRHREALDAPLCKSPDLNVVSFGGGPASELVGLLHYLGNEGADEGVTSISYRIYDKDGAWEGTAGKVVRKIVSDIDVDMTYHELDLADSAASAQVDVGDADLIIFSYIMSELCALDAKDIIAKNVNAILGTMKSGATMLFVESKQPEFINYFKLCKGYNGKEKNDNGGSVDIALPAFSSTFQKYETELNRRPRMSSDSILSKWYVKS